MSLSKGAKRTIDDIILRYEGGYVIVHDKDDPGGLTYAGITKKYNPGFPGWDIIGDGKKELHHTVHLNMWCMVLDWYGDHYWDPLELSRWPENLQHTLCSSSVLHGAGKTAEWMQMILREHLGFPYLKVDRAIGPRTMEAVGLAFSNDPDGHKINEFLSHFRTYRMNMINYKIAQNPKLVKFRKGWHNRISLDTVYRA